MNCYPTEPGIDLLFVPDGLTYKLQPLDRFVFGVMKVDHQWLCCARAGEVGAMNKQVTAALLVRTWEAVSSEVLNDLRSINEDFDQSKDRDEKTRSHFRIEILKTEV
jgi:hypothetical protein